jgi:HEAT repeat protein
MMIMMIILNIAAINTVIMILAWESIFLCEISALERRVSMHLFGPPDIGKLKANRDIKGLIKALGYDKDVRIQEAAIEALGEVGDASAVEPLLVVMKSNQESVAGALAKIGDRRAVEPLIRMLKTAEFRDEKVVAAQALGKLKDPRAIDPLVEALQTNIFLADNLRQAATQALIEIGAPAIEPLLPLLQSKHVAVRQAASWALYNLHYDPPPGAAGARYWVAQHDWKKCVAIGEAAVDALIAAFEEESVQVRCGAAEALGEIGDARAIPALCMVLNDESKVVRDTIADALVRFGAAAYAPLLKVLQGKNGNGRAAAAVALGKLGNPDAVDALLEALQDQNVQTRATVAKALGALGDRKAVEALVIALKDKKKEAREAAAAALVQIGAPAPSSLVSLLRDEEESTRRTAANILRETKFETKDDDARAWYLCSQGEWDKCLELGAQAVEPLLLALQDSEAAIRKEAARTLGRIGDARSVEPLVAALKDTSVDVRQEACLALGEIGATAAVDALIDFGLTGNQVGPAALALKRIGGPSFERVISMLGYLVDPSKRAAAIRILGEIGDLGAVDPLLAQLKNANPEVRNAAAHALANLGDPRAFEPLLEAFQDGTSVTTGALGRLGDERAFEPLQVAAGTGSRAAIAELAELCKALDAKGWKPGQDERGAWFWISIQKWDECVALGAAAIGPLLVMLRNNEWKIRQSAARILVKLHASRLLDEAARQKILEQREIISQPHQDYHEDLHSDSYNGVCGVDEHTDEGTNHGIGVEFPL